MFEGFIRVAVLFLQVIHILVLGAMCFFIYRYHNGEEYSLKAASFFGLLSVPFAMLLLGILLSRGEPDGGLYGICAIGGLAPVVMQFMKKQ